MTEQRRKIVVFLGGPRSGTSLTTNMAHALGLIVTPKLVGSNGIPLSSSYQDPEIFASCREILRYFYRYGWRFSYLPMPVKWTDDVYVKNQIDLLTGFVRMRLAEAGGGIWGIEGLATEKLLPVWKVVFDELRLDPIYILSLHNPANAIDSFVKACGVPNVLAELNWLTRYSDAIRHTQGNLIVMDFDAWFSRPREQCQKLQKALGFELKRVDEIIADVIDEQLYVDRMSTCSNCNKISDELYRTLCSYSGLNDKKKLININMKVLEYLDGFSAFSIPVDYLGKSLDNYERPHKRILNSQSNLKEIKNKIVGGVASFQKRLKVFEQMVKSIVPQLDHLIVYLNNYEEVPDFLIDPKITVFRSQDLGDISANGKVYYIDKLKSCYFFSLDDDVEYPVDYVDKMIRCLNKYENKVGVAVHGSIFPRQVQWYFERYALYSFQKELKTDKFVTLIGSGTFAFHTDILKAKFADFCGDVMVDLRFSILARKQKVPLVCIARPERWLKALVPDEGLFQQNLKQKTHHTTTTVRYNPWSYEVFKSIIQPVVDDCFKGIDDEKIESLQLDKQYIYSLNNNEVPDNWQETDRFQRNVEERRAVFDPIGYRQELVRQKKKIENSTSFVIGQLISKAFRRPGINTILLPYSILKHVASKVR